MAPSDFTIGQMASLTGCKVPTIRYFEQIGLLPAPPRTAGNRRVYNPSHLARLRFIRHCRDLGFGQSAVRELLDLTDHPDWSCDAVSCVASDQLSDISDRIERLTVLKRELERIIDSCSGGTVADCKVIEALAEHSANDL